MNRDYLCQLTKNTYPLEAAQICPLSLAMQKQDHPELFIDFAPALSVFWSTEKVDKCLHSMKKNAETVANSIALTPSAHQFWEKALFALRPIFVNNEKTKMRQKFYWLKAISSLEQGSSMLLPETITDDYMTEPPILSDCLDSGGRDHHENLSKATLMLFDCEGRNIVTSGNDIIITTPDPEHLPLPDEDLLWLQWTLHRLAALCVSLLAFGLIFLLWMMISRSIGGEQFSKPLLQTMNIGDILAREARGAIVFGGVAGIRLYEDFR